jgi:uncharacterized tellurite resistance protein B-like protein
MLNAITEFLGSLRPKPETATPPYDAVQLGAAALVVHLAWVDGAFSVREAAWLRQAVESYTGLSGDDAERFIALAEQIDRETDDFAASVESLRRRLAPDQRLSLVALLWRTAMADGVLHEFEEDLVMRIGELLGLSAPEAEAIRAAELSR